MREDSSSLVDSLRSEIRSAANRLAPFGLRTPALPARRLGFAEGTTFLKCENLQRTGSFKLRGALNKISSLSPELRARGVTSASTGNHGLAVGEALQMLGGRGTVVVSEGAAEYKRKRLAATGLDVVVVDGDALAAERHARALAERDGLLYVSPYNDLEVVAGQGTAGVEIVEQVPDVELVFVPVGGGGLISGVAAAVKSVRPSARVIGCWAERAPAMFEAMRAGRATEIEDIPTLADGTAGGIEPGAITIPLCQALVDDCVLVPERAMFRAMRDVLLHEHLVIEGAAGAAVAGCRRYMSDHPEQAHRRAVILLCGGQVGPELLGSVIRDELPSAVADST